MQAYINYSCQDIKCNHNHLSCPDLRKLAWRSLNAYIFSHTVQRSSASVRVSCGNPADVSSYSCYRRTLTVTPPTQTSRQTISHTLTAPADMSHMVVKTMPRDQSAAGPAVLIKRWLVKVSGLHDTLMNCG